MPTPFFKHCITGLLIFSIALPLNAQESVAELARQGLQMMKEGMQFKDEVEDIKNITERNSVDENLLGDLQAIADKAPQVVKDGNKLLPEQFQTDEMPDWLQNQISEAERQENKPKIILFASRAMRELELMELLREATYKNDKVDIQVVLKGIYPEESLLDAMKEVKKLAKRGRFETPPNVVIDPRMFKKYNIETAPQMLYMQNDEVLLQASGIFSVDWMLEQYERRGEAGDIGSYGDVAMVNEVDLMELMQQRWMNLDFQSMGQRVVDNYWVKQNFIELGRATDNARYKYDPTVVVSRDITTPDGHVLVERGTKVNPLWETPFNYKLIIFDAMDLAQVHWVKDQVVKYEAEGKPIQLIATRINQMSGWEHLKKLDESFGYPVYILDKSIQTRFNIQRVPALVEADDAYFYVENFKIDRQYRSPNFEQGAI